VAAFSKDLHMKKILWFAVLALAGGCSNESTDAGGEGGASCTPAAAYPNEVSPVIGAFITRVYRAHQDPAERDALLAKAAGSAASETVEAARAQHAVDFLIRGYLAPWVTAAGVQMSAWQATLPATQLTYEEASVAAQRALHLISIRRDALVSAPWDGAWDAGASVQHALIVDNIPGVPQGWYAATDVFTASFQAAYVVGQGAGTAAFQAESDPQKAIAAAVGAVLAANGSTGAAVRAATTAEVDALLAIK
jgi:hypothetical protein